MRDHLVSRLLAAAYLSPGAPAAVVAGKGLEARLRFVRE